MSVRQIDVGAGTEFSLSGVTDDDQYFQSLNIGSEKAFGAVCKRLLRQQAVCFDIGANIGVTALTLQYLFPDAMIFAYEAGERVFECLRGNLDRNPAGQGVQAVRRAISDKVGVVRFAENSAFGLVSDSGDAVLSTTIDAEVRRLGLSRLDFIKMDIEGHEEQAIDGAMDTIATLEPTWFIEFNTWCQVAYTNTHPRRFLEKIYDIFSYVAVVLEETGGLQRIPHSDLISLLYSNFYTHQHIRNLVLSPRQID